MRTLLRALNPPSMRDIRLSSDPKRRIPKRALAGSLKTAAGDDSDTPHSCGFPFSPEDTWEVLQNERPQIPCLILDCLDLRPHPSHLSFPQALALAMLLEPASTFLVGFVHSVAHKEWEAACREIQGTRQVGEEDEMIARVEHAAAEHGHAMADIWKQARGTWGGYIRPAFDGQLLVFE
jgi:hypothetical protein